jgi:hypothetical protein
VGDSAGGAPPPSRISGRAVAAAAALIEDYFKPMAQRVLGDATLPEADRLAATMARWILDERPELSMRVTCAERRVCRV